MIQNAKFSGYYFYMNTNIQGDFQICISVPLIMQHFPKTKSSILVIFQNFTMFYYKSSSPQRNLTCCITNLVYGLPRELPNNLMLGILGDGKSLKFEWRHSPAPVSLQEIKLWQQQFKSRDQTFLYLSNFSGFPRFFPNTLSGIGAALKNTYF